MLKKNLKKVIIFTLLITILISSTCLAATPKLINNLEKKFKYHQRMDYKNIYTSCCSGHWCWDSNEKIQFWR